MTTQGATGPAELDVDGYLDDPRAELQRLAAQHWYAQGLDTSLRPTPFVLSFEQVRSLLRERRLTPRSFTDDMLAAGISVETAHQLTPLFRRDGEDHRQHRALLSAAFTPRSVERLRPVAAEVADRLADGIAATGGRCEFVHAFAAPMPPEVFAVLFGLPVDDAPVLGRWATSVAKAFFPEAAAGALEEIEQAAAELRDYSREQIERRRAEPTDDLISRLLETEIDGKRLDDVDIVEVMSGFIFAGSETTKNQLREMIVVFAAHPDAWIRVHDDPDLIPTAVDEVMRFRPIVPALTRVAIEPIDHDGLHVEPDQRVILSFTTANNDPAHFERADVFAVDRANAGDHLTFGWGPHFCVGAGLARVELQESLRALAARFAAPELLQPADEKMVTWSEPLEVQFQRREERDV